MGDSQEPAGDALGRWLQGEGLATLDCIAGDAMDVVGVVDHELTLRYVNWTVPGLTREAIVGNSALDLAPPDYRELAKETYESVLQTGERARFEIMYRDETNLLMWDVRVGPIRSDGDVIGLIAITSDVTELRRAHADRDRFFSLSLDMLAVVDPDGHFKRVNPAFGETLAYGRTDLVGKPFMDFVHPEDRARTKETFQQIRGGTPVGDFENRYQRRDGDYRVFSWRSNVDPITGDVYAVARDITDQRHAEGQLRHAQKMDAVGQLAGGVAHDFNNILLAILANAELAKGAVGASPKALEHLREIENAGHRAAALTKQLLAFSRRQPLRLVPVDLNSLLHGLMTLLRRLLPENIAIDLVTATDLAPVRADPSQLEQVVVNLCVNARDAMQHGGQLTIETVSGSSDASLGVVMRVMDTGTGMSPEVREHAFEPFFTTKAASHGTGLGLSTVYGIVQQHGGAIEVESELGQGTTFTVRLPAGRSPAVAPQAPVNTSARGGTETILLAEDDERVRSVVVRVLERAGYRTLAASNGAEAVRLLLAQAAPVNLVLLDLVMPEQGGQETWEQMRRLRPELRVLFASGYGDAQYRSLLPPDANVLGKPFRNDELLRRIREILDA